MRRHSVLSGMSLGIAVPKRRVTGSGSFASEAPRLPCFRFNISLKNSSLHVTARQQESKTQTWEDAMLDINVRSNTGRVLCDYSIEEPESIERVVAEAALD